MTDKSGQLGWGVVLIICNLQYTYIYVLSRLKVTHISAILSTGSMRLDAQMEGVTF